MSTLTVDAVDEEPFTMHDFQRIADRMHVHLDCNYIPRLGEEPCVALCGDFSVAFLRTVIAPCVGHDKAAELLSSVCMHFTVSGLIAFWPKVTTASLIVNELELA